MRDLKPKGPEPATPRRVSIFGATGSIGQNTIDLIAREPERFDVVALTGGRNIPRLAADARRLNADIAVTAFEACLSDLKAALAGSGVAVAAGPAALIEAAARPVDWAMSAIVGAAGLAPGLEALQHGTTLALANKESLVCAGPLLLAEAQRHGATILPVDSEHSAIFQAMTGESRSAVERVIITASGGAFRDWPEAKLATATPDQAATHPNWAMGQRITIDSATLFNKGMELIEAREFFDLEPGQIEVVIHPESLIHALVGYADGGLIAHVGPHDMRHAIGYALNYPDRRALPVERLDLIAAGTLTFRPPNEARHPALRLARETMAMGGTAGAAFNAAKETALDRFIAQQIGFLDMAAVVERTLEEMHRTNSLARPVTLDAVAETDRQARRIAQSAQGAGLVAR